MSARLPPPLEPGDRIAVTSPSSGIEPALAARFGVAVDVVRRAGYAVEVGACMGGTGVVSAPARERAAELQRMLLDPAIKAIVPPWGGELAVEILPHLDFAAIAEAAPTWVVGYSDISTLLVPLTTLGGIATLHGQNLMDTPYLVPAPMVSWLDLVSRPAGSIVAQGAAAQVRGVGFDDYATTPSVDTYRLDQPGGWSLLDPEAGPLRASGVLIGGCIETVSILAGTAFGRLDTLGAPRIVYLEASADGAVDIARDLWRIRFAGWFDDAVAVLIGRTHAPATDDFTQLDAVRSAMEGLNVPVVLDVDCGHVPPHLSLLNGVDAQVVVDGDHQTIVQCLVGRAPAPGRRGSG